MEESKPDAAVVRKSRERTFFLSYSRRDSEAAVALAAELDRFGQRVWLDKELSGGEIWWDTILRRIRECDCFVFAQSRASVLESEACVVELKYAHSLGKPILPVLVGDSPSDRLLPPFLAEAQRVDARDRASVTHALARALFALPDSPPLPEPLPPAPAVPISYLDTLAERVAREGMTLSDQRLLLADIKQELARNSEPDAVVELLRIWLRRDDIFAPVAGEIEGILGTLPAAPSRSTDPAPAERPVTVATRRYPRWMVTLAVIGGIVVALLVWAMLSQPDCYVDAFGQVFCG